MALQIPFKPTKHDLEQAADSRSWRIVANLLRRNFEEIELWSSSIEKSDDQLRGLVDDLSAIVKGIKAGVVGASESTNSTTYTNLTSFGPEVTTKLPGTHALVYIGGALTGSNGSSCLMSFAVSGASSLAASDTYAYGNQSDDPGTARSGRLFYVPSLNPGDNTFTVKYRRSLVGTGTATFAQRLIVVIPLP